MPGYLGDLKETSGTALDSTLLKTNETYNYPQGVFYFIKKYKKYPCIFVSRKINVLYEFIALNIFAKYNHDSKNDIVEFKNRENHIFKNSILADLENGVMIRFSDGNLVDNLEPDMNLNYTESNFYHVFQKLKIFYIPESQEIVNNIISLINSAHMKEKIEESIKIISKTSSGKYYLSSNQSKKAVIRDFKLNYGEKFEKIHQTIINALKNEEARGLILLHGISGSGKTHYIRFLIQEFKDKKFIYAPPDMTSSISTPEFFPFVLENKKSVLIIEDAENIIGDRRERASTSQAVANLLNLSDGLLGDALHQPIIATFNCELSNIDPALLRKGRLITQYKFDKLNIEDAQKLSDSIGFNSKISEPMTLADVYNQEREDLF